MRKALASVLAAIMFLDVICLGVILVYNAGGKSGKSAKEGTQDIFERASVIATGNNIIGEEMDNQAAARSNSGGYDFDFVYENIADEISAADEAIITQEAVISKDHNVSGYPLYNAPTQLGDELKSVGFDTINTATNHILDYGEQGLLNTYDYLKNEKKLNVIGIFEDKTAAATPVIRNVNGIKIAYVAFTQSTNGNSLPENSQAYLLLSEYEDKIAEMISSAKAKADFVIVCAHWGDEYGAQITTEQETLAKKLGEWGADVVIGTHPHELQKAEYIENADGSKTLVAYSLGNLVSTQTKGELMLGGLLKFDVVKNKVTGEVTLENVGISGVVTHYGVDMTKIRIYRLEDYTQELASVHGVKERTPDFSLNYLKDLLKDRIDSEFLR